MLKSSHSLEPIVWDGVNTAWIPCRNEGGGALRPTLLVLKNSPSFRPFNFRLPVVRGRNVDALKRDMIASWSLCYG